MLERKKLGIAMIGLSICILLFTFTISKINNDETKDNLKNITLKDQIDKYNNEQKVVIKGSKNNIQNTIINGFSGKATNYQKLVVEKRISIFIDSLNNREFIKAYSMLNKQYLKTFGVTLNYFQTKYMFTDNKLYFIRDIKTYYDRSIVTILLVNEKDYKAKLKTMPTTEMNATIYSDGTIDDIGIEKIDNISIKEIKNNIEIEIVKEIKLKGSTIYNVIIKNNSDKDMVIKNESDGIEAEGIDQNVSHNLYNSSYFSNIVERHGETNIFIEFKYVQPISSLAFHLQDGDNIKIIIQ